MIGLEWPGGCTSGDLVHHGCLYFQEIALIKVLADVLDDLGSGDEGVSGLLIHDKVEETISETLLGVLVSTVCYQYDAALNKKFNLQVLRWQHPQAGGEKNDLSGEDTEFTLTSLLGVCAAREADDTDDVASLDVLVLLLEGYIGLGFLQLAHDLDI